MLDDTLETDYTPLRKDDNSKTIRLLTILTIISCSCLLIFIIIFGSTAIKISGLIDKGDTFFNSANDLVKNDVPKQFEFYQQLVESQNKTVVQVEKTIEETLTHLDNIIEQYKNQSMTQKIVQITDNLDRITKELNMTFIEDTLYGIKEDLDKIAERIGVS
jgi:predicted PurR-regulated permease PerM